MWYANFITEMKKSIYTAKLCVQLYALEWSASQLYLCMLWTEAGWAPLLVWAWWWRQSSSSGKESTLVAGPIASYSKPLYKHNAVCTPRMTYFVYQWLTLLSLSGNYIKPWFSRTGHPWKHNMWCVAVWLCLQDGGF